MTEKLTLKKLAAELAEFSRRLESLESRAPSPSRSPVCHICGKPGDLQMAPIPLGDKLSPRALKPVHAECLKY